MSKKQITKLEKELDEKNNCVCEAKPFLFYCPKCNRIYKETKFPDGYTEVDLPIGYVGEITE